MKTWKKKTKTSEVLRHLREHGHINQLEAWKYYRASRLSAIIFNLRHSYGLAIISKDVPFVDEYGTNSDYVDYYLIEDLKEEGIEYE